MMFSSRRVFILPYTASHLWFWLISHSHRPSAVVMNSETWASVAFSLRHGIYVNSQSCRTGLHAIHSCTWWVRAWKKKKLSIYWRRVPWRLGLECKLVHGSGAKDFRLLQSATCLAVFIAPCLSSHPRL